MSKRSGCDISNTTIKKKSCDKFKLEWLSEIVETKMPSSMHLQKVRIGEIFVYSETYDCVKCIICSEANMPGEFTSGKKWTEWRLFLLKRHLSHKAHRDAITKLNNLKTGGLLKIMTETPEERKNRIEITERKKSSCDLVKVLIDNVLLAIKINASMCSVQDIHNHVSKYTDIPESWRSKNYGFEFVECINAVIKKEYFDEFRKSRFHTLIVDESTDISVQKILILYVKYRYGMNYKTIFAGIIKLCSCDSNSIFSALKKFYSDNEINIQNMVMFTSDGAAVMLGKKNGVAAMLKREINHLTEQHCVAHREDLGIDDAWKQVSIMQDIETLLKTTYTMFSRSSVKKGQFEELSKFMESDVVSFRPINEVRWLSRHFAVSAFVRNYNVLIDYCTEQVDKYNDPINKYCLKMLKDPQIHVSIMILNDVLGELSSMCKYFQRSNITSIEATQFAKAKINQLRAQYLSEVVHWSKDVKNILSLNSSDINLTAILRFIQLLCDHLEMRFPEEELLEWRAFDQAAIGRAKEFEYGKDQLDRLIFKYTQLLQITDKDTIENMHKQYCNLKFIVAEKVKTGSIQTFADLLTFAHSDPDQFDCISVLLDICGTFQASSAECERGFSLMNAIKSRSRNRMEVEHLECLLRIKSYISSGENVDLNVVYKYWVDRTDRREKK